MPSRHVTNPYLAGGSPPSFDAHAYAQSLLPALHECVARRAMPLSTGQWQQDHSIYTGLGGVALAHLRMGTPESLRTARTLAQRCIDADPSSECVSFFCGTPGGLTIVAIASHLLGDAAQRDAACVALLGWRTRAESHEEDELLFGRVRPTRRIEARHTPPRASAVLSPPWSRHRLATCTACFSCAQTSAAHARPSTHQAHSRPWRRAPSRPGGVRPPITRG